MRRTWTALALGSAVLLAGGCAGGGAVETVTVAYPVSRPAQTLNPSEASPPVRRRQGRSEPQSAYVGCDPNISAKASTTSCEFATNAFYEYWIASGAPDIEVYSPAAGRSFATRCTTRGERVTCSTADGGSVRFPRWAVDAYTASAAAAYARVHDVTPVGSGPDTPAPSEEPLAEPAEQCDSSYQGACLDPAASDYDCDGGSGDGPYYTGPVQVVGYDRHGLDSDGDGYACE